MSKRAPKRTDLTRDGVGTGKGKTIRKFWIEVFRGTSQVDLS